MPTLRKLTYDDLWNFKEMGNAALSPDGKRVAFSMNRLDKDKDERLSAIWLLHLDEQGHAVGEPRQLTSGVKNDTNPAWAPDSKRLLFLSNREEEKNQLWIIDTDGGEAQRLTNMLHGVSEAEWSPDGQWIAFTAPVRSSDEDDVLLGRKQLTAEEKKQHEDREKFRLRSVNTIWYRLDGYGLFEKPSQLFVMPAPTTDGKSLDPTTIRCLTSSEADLGYGQPHWTPDSMEIGLLHNSSENRDRSMVNDLWLISRETGNARCLTDGTLQIDCYAWSPDGQQAIIVGEKDFRIEGSSNAELYLVSRDSGDLHSLTSHLDNHASIATGTGGFGRPGPYLPQWSADGQRIYFLLTEHGRINVQRVDLSSGVSTALTDEECVTFFLALLPDERGLVLIQAHPLHPWEFSLLPLQDAEVAEPVRLTHIYDGMLVEFAWSKPERIVYHGVNDEKIDGWLVRPLGAREGVRYPMLLNIHGGPQSAYGVGMSMFFQYLAAQGFAVFYCNPHGSTGCGQAFMREVEGDWGGWDYQDIMRGVDECIQRGVVDPERLVVTGYSYGGYMSMFIIGQTGRFKAAVPMAGVSNLASFVGTSDIGFWQVAQAKGYPWDPERATYYRERSPLTHAAKVTTPTLLIHPENDLRCPIEQSEQFYMALKMMGKVPVEFLRGPASWHIGTVKPGQYFDRWQKMLDWFGQYVEVQSEG